MYNFYKILIYKLYRIAIAQEKTVNSTIGFLGFISIFELFHFSILDIIFDYFGFKYELVDSLVQYSGWIFVIVGFSLNYFIFIKTKLIYRINDYYQGQKRVVWRDNLLFFVYIVLLFLIMLLQTWWYQKNK